VSSLTASTIAGAFSLAAFAVAILAGLSSGNPAASVLLRALIAMIICYPAGMAIGLVAQRLVQSHIDAHRAANPALELVDGDEDGSGNEIDADDEEVIVV
jgi:putative Mn2+ efflux pump MntP